MQKNVKYQSAEMLVLLWANEGFHRSATSSVGQYFNAICSVSHSSWTKHSRYSCTPPRPYEGETRQRWLSEVDEELPQLDGLLADLAKGDEFVLHGQRCRNPNA